MLNFCKHIVYIINYNIIRFLSIHYLHFIFLERDDFLFYNSNLKYLMSKNNLNKNQFAIKLNVSRQNIQHLLNASDPKATTIITISRFFNVGIEDLLLKDLRTEQKNDDK